MVNCLVGARPPPSAHFRVPGFVYAFALICSLIGLLLFFVPVGVKSAFAATVWPGSTFSYGGQTYPDNLAGVTVTFNQYPGAPDSYLGLSGGNIMWYSGRYYQIGGHVEGTASSVPDSGEYWLSESTSAGANPWFIYCTPQQAFHPTPNNSFYYNGNPSVRAWWPSGTSRTITFAYGQPVGDTTLYADLPLLYHHDFIRYVVDNSDFRSRYTFSSQPAPTWADITVSMDSTGHLVWTIPSNNPSCRAWVQFSSDQSTWSNYQMFNPQTPGQSYSYLMPEAGYWRINFIHTDSNTSYQVSNVNYWSNPSIWSGASVTYDSTLQQFTIQKTDPDDEAKLIIQFSSVLDGAWQEVLTIDYLTYQYLWKPAASGFYRFIFGNQGASMNQVYQTITSEYIEIPISESPQYVGYFYYPDQRYLYVQFSSSAPKPSLVELQYSSDGGVTWFTFSSTTTLVGQPLVNLPVGWYAEFSNIPSSYYRVLVNSVDYYLIGNVGGSSGGDIIVPEESPGGWLSNTISWITDFYNGMQPFTQALLGWMPEQLLSIFVTLVLISLAIGLVVIVRGH